MNRPLPFFAAHDDREQTLAIDNPLCLRDPQLFAACAEHRKRCLRQLLIGHAAKDLHKPGLLADLHYDFTEVKACLQVFDVLALAQWTQADLDRFAGYFASAWKGRGGLFPDCADHARFEIQMAVEEAHKELSRLAEPKIG